MDEEEFTGWYLHDVKRFEGM